MDGPETDGNDGGAPERASEAGDQSTMDAPETDGNDGGAPERASEAADQSLRPSAAEMREREEVEHPAKLLRIAHMVKSMLDEVRTTELDEAGRRRLADIHNRAVEELRGIVSEDLQDELADVRTGVEGDDAPTGDELRVAQAQLAGWLEGLFRGIQASMAAQARQAQQQLVGGQGGQGPDDSAPSGQYL